MSHHYTAPFFMPLQPITKDLKMAEETTNANAGTEESTEGQGSLPETEIEIITDDEGLASTTEFKSVEVETKEVETKTDDEANSEVKADADDAANNTSKDLESKDFSQHPRFQELISQNNESQEKIAALEKQVNEGTKTEPEYKLDWSTDEGMINAFTENPKQFMTEMFQQFRVENSRLDGLEKQETLQTQRVADEKSTLENYFTKTDGAIEMWKDGSIQKFQEENPGHTAISAHRALTEDSRIETALKAEREKWNTELKLKGRSTSLSNNGNPPRQISEHDDELKNPDKHGGNKNVLVTRLKRMMAS